MTPEQKAEMDAVLARRGIRSTVPQGIATPAVRAASGMGLTPEMKAEMDAVLAQRGISPKGTASRPVAEKKPGFLASIAKPFAKAGATAYSAIEGIGELGAAGLSSITGDKEGAQKHIQKASDAQTKQRDLGILGKVRPVGIDQKTGERQSIPRSFGDIVGTGAELGAYLAPVGTSGKAVFKGIPAIAAKPAAKGVAAVAAQKAVPGFLQGGMKAAAPLLKRAVGEGLKYGATAGALSSGGRALSEGDNLKQGLIRTGVGTLAGGVIGGAIPAVSFGTRLAVHGAGKVAAGTLGRLTGAQEAAIKKAFDTNAVEKTIKSYDGDINALKDDALTATKKALKNLEREQSKTYRTQLEGVRGSADDLTAKLSATKQEVTDDLLSPDWGIKITEHVDDLGNSRKTLDFDESVFTDAGEQSAIKRAFDTLDNWKDMTPGGVDTLKKRLGKIIPKQNGPAKALVTSMKNEVDDLLKTNVGGYSKMTSGFRQTQEIIDEMEQVLSLGDSASKDTAIRKLTSSLNQNQETRLSLIRQLEKLGGGDIETKLAAAALAPSTPRGLQGGLSSFGLLGSFSVGNIPGTIAYLLATSPRLAAKFVTILGEISRVQGPTVPTALKRALENVLREAVTESANQNP